MERKNKARRRIAPPEYRLRNRAVFYLSIPLLERYVAADVVALRGPTVGSALGIRRFVFRRDVKDVKEREHDSATKIPFLPRCRTNFLFMENVRNQSPASSVRDEAHFKREMI